MQLKAEFINDEFNVIDWFTTVKDITRRHILLATDAGLRLLGLARTWWCDGTFKISKYETK